jgi:hypothetical protein
MFCLQTQGLYLEVHKDVEVSSGEDDVPKTDALVDQKKSTDDDAEDEGASSAEPITTNAINFSAPGQFDPFATIRVAAPVLPTGKRGRKCPLPATKRNRPLDQVMTQIENPPYHGPRSPLDLVAIEINFGCIFEVFCHIT